MLKKLKFSFKRFCWNDYICQVCKWKIWLYSQYWTKSGVSNLRLWSHLFQCGSYYVNKCEVSYAYIIICAAQVVA